MNSRQYSDIAGRGWHAALPSGRQFYVCDARRYGGECLRAIEYTRKSGTPCWLVVRGANNEAQSQQYRRQPPVRRKMVRLGIAMQNGSAAGACVVCRLPGASPSGNLMEVVLPPWSSTPALRHIRRVAGELKRKGMSPSQRYLPHEKVMAGQEQVVKRRMRGRYVIQAAGEGAGPYEVR